MTHKPQASAGMKCPLWRKDMSKVCHTCEFWNKITGQSPIARFLGDTGEWIDKWGCTLSHQHLFQATAAKATCDQTKELNELRNEVGTAHRTQSGLAAELTQSMQLQVRAMDRFAQAAEAIVEATSRPRIGAANGHYVATLNSDDQKRLVAKD